MHSRPQQKTFVCTKNGKNLSCEVAKNEDSSSSSSHSHSHSHSSPHSDSSSRSNSRSLSDSDTEWDYIIVGLGTAGSILARKLSDDLKTRVLVIESGENHLRDPVLLNPNWLENQAELAFNPKYSKNYPIPYPGTFTAISYSEGRGWGGGASHNFLLAGRSTARIYNNWASVTGDSRWSYASLLPKMIALEKYTGTTQTPAQRGRNGPISITQREPIGPGVNAYIDSLSEVANAPFKDDYNVSPSGDIATSAGQEFRTPGPSGRRSYGALEFLTIGTIVDNDGNGLRGRKLKIVSDAIALRANFDGTRAYSVTYVYTHETNRIFEPQLSARGKLILTAGAVQTPKFLLNSGVGPAAELSALGIPVVVNSPQVGKNLQCHYGSQAIIGTAVPFEAQVFSDGFFDSEGTRDGARRIQILNVPFGPAGPSTSVLAILNPLSRGSITLVEKNDLTDPKINLAYFSDAGSLTPPYAVNSDAFLVVQFYKMIRAAAKASETPLFYPPPEAFDTGNDADLLRYAKSLDYFLLYSHIVGTARMGTNISNAVVDSSLNVFGLDNVIIGDLSITPLSPDVNPALTAYYIALNLASFLGVPTPPAL